jgi:serine/threonine protein kinase
MGEVYKARDTRLDRTVAIKVLPSHVASNPEVRQRFEREARAVSSLNHPHICTLYDIGSENGVDFLVMEHIEGESLADRLNKGALPFDQALKHAIEIADALDNAHRQGVVHRDLKPGNIMLTKSGAKLLDFGLAKQQSPASSQETSGLSALPTEQKPLTEKGSILGTFQYMAPEQLEGKEADARTDLFSFGAVLYEMVTGRKTFEGKSQAGLITAIMGTDPPPISTLQPMTPPALERLVKRCLAKDPDGRWQTASDLMEGLSWIQEGGLPADVPTAEPPISRRTVALGLTALVVAGLTIWNLAPPPTPRPVMRFPVVLPPTERLSASYFPVVALSPDGTNLVYVAGEPALVARQLYLRPINQLESAPLRGTEGAESPFFSPDGQWVGFWARGQLKKVPISGGAPITLCGVEDLYGASWGSDNTIVFGSERSKISQVSDGGGTPEVLITLGEDEFATLPESLPGGKAVLFSNRQLGSWDEAEIVVQSPGGERKVLIRGGTNARYLPTGHLVYAARGTLLAVPFDVARLEVTGSPVPLVEGVRWANRTGVSQFTVSESGSRASGGQTALASRSSRSLSRARLCMCRPEPLVSAKAHWSGWIEKERSLRWRKNVVSIRIPVSHPMASGWRSILWTTPTMCGSTSGNAVR